MTDEPFPMDEPLLLCKTEVFSEEQERIYSFEPENLET